MEWTDTLMFEAMPTISLGRTSPVLERTRVVSLEGVTLLHVSSTCREETVDALNLLRGFRATGRRVVLCNTSELVVGRQFGHQVVEQGAAKVLVSCGISGREVGIGARDAGLDLSSVVVCGEQMAASKVLSNQVMPGDTILLLGIDTEVFEEVVTQLEARFSVKPALAA